MSNDRKVELLRAYSNRTYVLKAFQKLLTLKPCKSRELPVIRQLQRRLSEPDQSLRQEAVVWPPQAGKAKQLG